jgi:hypothetical protein
VSRQKEMHIFLIWAWCKVRSERPAENLDIGAVNRDQAGLSD